MTSPDLPASLKAALSRKIEGLSQNEVARHSAAISETYRAGGTSAAIRTANEALAYALARMPATYAAVAASLNALREQHPAFRPRSLLDVGSGPGTAIWAAQEAFESLDKVTALDANPALRDLALEFASAALRPLPLTYTLGQATALIREAPAADLVVASYVINELDEAARSRLADEMWDRTRDTLLVIEPGTPSGYARVLALRGQLIAKGAHVLAPCPHEGACPLVAPDWCHFSQRLQRSRAHKHLKGADAPFEDERFSYVALSRTSPEERMSRVLAQPAISKAAVTAKLCTPDGLRLASIARRDKAAFAAARRWDWGDAVSGGN